MQTGKFVPEKSNIWRDCVDGYYDWVKEHIEEVGGRKCQCGAGRRRLVQLGTSDALHSMITPCNIFQLKELFAFHLCRVHH